MKFRRLRQRRRGRIEIIPMIDVMFFLLATFMLASLSLQNLHSLTVNLPRGQAAPAITHRIDSGLKEGTTTNRIPRTRSLDHHAGDSISAG